MSCLKKAFDTYEEARHVAYKYITPSNYIHPYRCDSCGKWHNGHLPYALRQKLGKR